MPVGKEKIGVGEKKEGNLAAVSAQSDVLLARRQVSQHPLLREKVQWDGCASDSVHDSPLTKAKHLQTHLS